MKQKQKGDWWEVAFCFFAVLLLVVDDFEVGVFHFTFFVP